MKRILITGATGNIGTEVVHYLYELENESEIIVAVRNIERAKNKFADFPKLIFEPPPKSPPSNPQQFNLWLRLGGC